MDRMIRAGVRLFDRRHGVAGARLVPGGEDDAGALFGETDGGDLTYTGGCTGYDDGFSVHVNKAPNTRFGAL